MEMREFQEKTRLTAGAYEEGAANLAVKMALQFDHSEHVHFLSVVYLVTKLAGEAGEVSSALGKYVRGDYDLQEFYERVAKETLDTLWYVARILDELKLDLDAEAWNLISHLLRRQEEGKLRGDGSDR